jgi:hypothetical protein
MTFDFVSPRLIDAILAAIAFEATILFVFFPTLRRAADLWLTFISGAALMAAVRFALSGADKRVIAALLAAALIAHLLYLRTRITMR